MEEKIAKIKDVLHPETELEHYIMEQPEFVEGCFYGKPRPGHPEGEVLWHIREVLENIDEEQFMLDEYRAKLRLITLIHDTFKYQVDYNQPKTGNNHHGYKARVFAEKMLPTAAYADVLTVIQHHDDAYNIWNRANRGGKWSDALAKIDHFIKFLEEKMEDISLYSDFFYCDNKTGDKSMDPYNWFMYQV